MTFNKGMLGKVLTNSFYCGIMRVKEKEYKHRYPILISQQLWNQVKEVRDSFKKKPYKYAGNPYIYRGLIRCADCDCAITPEKHKGFVYYHCTQYKGKHGGKWLREEEITRQLGKVFKNLQIPEENLGEIIQTIDESNKAKAEFHTKKSARLVKEHKTLTTMLDNLYLDKLKGRITEDEYDRFYQSFRDQLAEITVKIEQLQDADANYHITAKYLLDLASRAFE
jgi:site-specific DNA recombinase